ncbi:type III-B CRISPR module-associated protein Cmr5 [Acinetobacter radioresistens]|uniref:type III-B CRISPR module-associated protein Cmr5 n=2 Tax=Acinetobacter radioresistens TaxID=40216 RepID=UPI002006D778|nr:type III-B CRISPR module-associated protein Cmr5 [Acinetobacter radioresistens]
MSRTSSKIKNIIHTCFVASISDIKNNPMEVVTNGLIETISFLQLHQMNNLLVKIKTGIFRNEWNMAKNLQELLGKRSLESQKRILEKANEILNNLVQEDRQLLKIAEEAQTEETVKLSLHDLRARVHKNRT